MLRQQSTVAAEEEEQEKLRVAEQAAEIISELPDVNEVDDAPIEELPTVSDTDSESTSTSDNEVDEKEKMEYISTASNVNINQLFTIN